MSKIENMDWELILNRLAGYATSELGKERLRKTEPLADAREAMQSFSVTEELKAVLQQGERPFMESLDMQPTWFQRLLKEATLKVLELKDIRRFCLEALALAEIFRPFETPWVSAQKSRIFNAEEPLSAIDQLITSDGEIRSDASETLHKLYTEKNQQTQKIQSLLDKLVKKHELENILQDRYVTNREGRHVLPIKSGMRHNFDGLIHATSASKQTVFMEPEEIIPLNNRLKEIDAEIEAEIDRLLQQISQYMSSLQEEFKQTSQALLETDQRLAMAQLAQTLSAQPVNFGTEALHLMDVRHPLLALMGVEVVANTVRLSEEQRILLLSGPNAGGKTVLLKSVGLAAQMARCGLQVCADRESTLPFFEGIVVAVGDSQSVDAHLSTFAAHLEILNQATEAKGPKHLLLIDEICGSTDPEEGSALARAFIESYAEGKAYGVITSHLGPLKLGWDENSGVINGSMEYKKETGQPTYKFLMGVPGQSLALKTAEKVGVKKDVLERAKEHLSPQSRAHQAAMGEVEQLKSRLDQVRKELETETKETKELKAKYALMLDQFNKEKEERLSHAVKKAEKKLDEIIERTKVDDLFRKHENLVKVKSEIPEVVKISPQRLSTGFESAEQFEKAFPPGSKVHLPHLGQDGIVQGPANAKGEVPVLANMLRVQVPWAQIRPPQSAPNPTSQVVRRTSSVRVALQENERTVDLRGKNVEEALSTLEIQLDQATLAQEDRVKIVHGHGTETLKRSVRSYLSRSSYVRKWISGGPESGGDGVTWVELGS